MIFKSLTLRQKGICSIIGGMLLNFVLGSFYLWGTINLYVASYFHQIDSSFTLENSLIIFPLMSLSFHSAAPISVKLCENLGFRLQMILCLILMCSSYYFALSFTSFWGFFFIFGFLFGLASGLTYLLPLYNAYKYFPDKRGLISGLILGAYGFGSMLTSPYLINFLNPDNEKPVQDQSDKNYYFNKEICDNLQYSLRMLALLFICLGISGIILCIEYEEDEVENLLAFTDELYPKENTKDMVIELHMNHIQDEKHSENEENPKLSKISQISNIIKKSIFNSKIAKWSIKTQNPEDQTQCNTVSEAIRSPLFYYILFFFSLSSSGGYFIAANYKNLGIITINDDNFLNIVGSVGAVSNGLGRVLWGILMDKFKFFNSFLLLLILEITILASLKIVLDYKWLYLIWVGISFFCLGGHPVIFPPFTIKSFGTKVGSKVYGILFGGMFFGNFLQTFIVMGLKNAIGFDNLGFVFIIGGIACALVLINVKLEF